MVFDPVVVAPVVPAVPVTVVLARTVALPPSPDPVVVDWAKAAGAARRNAAAAIEAIFVENIIENSSGTDTHQTGRATIGCAATWPVLRTRKPPDD
jgi:hypothetical protein